MKRLGVLPGTGWDNLRNIDMGMVLGRSYKQCKMTEDGLYLIPDDVFVIPLKTSNVQTFAELIENWTGYSSVTAASVNIEAHGTSSFGTISGSFSSDYKFCKERQVRDKAVTTRVQLRYVFYKVKSQPDTMLTTSFKNRLLEIAAHLQSNNNLRAEYLAQLLVRDFGTHVITGQDAGAALAKEDIVKTAFTKDSKNSASNIKVAAGYSYGQLFGVQSSVSTSLSKDFMKQYLGNRTSSKTYTHGGPPFASNGSLKAWESKLRDNLVAIDRIGDPLHYVITTAVLPELSEETVRQLASAVEGSVRQYFERNRYLGCTDLSSENFDYEANEDDGSCALKLSNFTFGGIYQTCKTVGTPRRDPCSKLVQKNPKTADYSCSTGYKAILIQTGKTTSNCKRKCSWWVVFRRCAYTCGYGLYQTFWCAAIKKTPYRSGYLFGGIYSQTSVNPFTRGKRCPAKYYTLRFGLTMKVCVSDNYELGAHNAAPFAGFFSCKVGNPLTLTSSNTTLSMMQENSTGVSNDMERFLFNLGPGSWPKHCPEGYSQHLAIIENDCEILYCIKANFLTRKELPNIRCPPFIEFPKNNPNMTIPLAILNDDTERVYLRNPEQGSWEMKTKKQTKNMLLDEYLYSGAKAAKGGLSEAATTGLTFGLTALSGIMIALIVLGLHWKRKKLNRIRLSEELKEMRRIRNMKQREVPVYINSVPFLKDGNNEEVTYDMPVNEETVQ